MIALVAGCLTWIYAPVWFGGKHSEQEDQQSASLVAAEAADLNLASPPQPPLSSNPSSSGSPAAPWPAEKKPDRLETSLLELAFLEREDPAAAQSFATRRKLTLQKGRVKTVLEAMPSQAQEAAAAVIANGGIVETTAGDLVQALLPLDRIVDLSQSEVVSRIRPPQQAVLDIVASRGTDMSVTAKISASQQPVTHAVTSEGVAAMNATAWQAAGKRGAGVKVAVLDPGFSGYQDRIAAGDLPATVTIQSFRADGDITGGGIVHGTACAEIVYDIAPEAQLYLVNFDTDVELRNAVNYLIDEKVDVISTSWGIFSGWPGDGSGPINDLVQQARDHGILWTTAAGNLAQNHWTGHFTDQNSNGWSEFAGTDENNYISSGASIPAGESIDLWLSWNRWPVTDQDYDLYLFKSGDPNPVASSTMSQNGYQSPEEEIHYTVPPGGDGTYYLKIYKYHASGDVNFQLYSYPFSLGYRVTRQSLGGAPTDAAAAVTTGAVPYNSTTIESFSSQGPTADGRVKPDVTGYDRVTTATYGANLFWGTSAAGPHAAGEAALIKSLNPSFSPSQIQNFMENQSLDLGVAGKDYIYGSGRLNLTIPMVGNITPTGTIYTSTTTVSADYADVSGSGLNLTTVNVTVDGNTLSGCTVTTASVSCPASNLFPGHHNVNVSVSDNNANNGSGSGGFDVARDYYWAWYDQYSAGAQNWILMANPVTAVRDLNFNLTIAGLAMNMSPFTLPGAGAGQVPPGKSLVVSYPGVMGGPVKNTSLTGQAAILSQRTLWAANSLEEVPATESSRLASHFYWTWYDQQTPGFTNWVLISNPNPYTVYYRIKIRGSSPPAGGTGSIPAGASATPTFPGYMGGAVEVETWKDGVDGSVPANVMASQRVLSSYGTAFNEVPGIPANELSDRYLWTWYDEVSPGAQDWVLVINPSAAASVYYQIDIGGGCLAPGTNKACFEGGPLAPGENVTPRFPGIMSGPVQVKGCAVAFGPDGSCSSPANVLASQRSLWGPSFEEVPGLPASLTGYSSLSSTYHWTWYDQKSAGSQNWVLVANPDPNPTSSIYYEIVIGNSLTPINHGTLAGGQYATPTFPGIMDGPVKVQAWTDESKTTPANVMASQRVLWHGYFNEVLGTVLNIN